MIDKLTRWETNMYGDGFDMSDTGDWLDFEEVKELLAEQEKKTKILLDALEEIKNMEQAKYSCSGEGYFYYCVEVAQEALEEYRKE